MKKLNVFIGSISELRSWCMTNPSHPVYPEVEAELTVIASLTNMMHDHLADAVKQIAQIPTIEKAQALFKNTGVTYDMSSPTAIEKAFLEAAKGELKQLLSEQHPEAGELYMCPPDYAYFIQIKASLLTANRLINGLKDELLILK